MGLSAHGLKKNATEADEPEAAGPGAEAQGAIALLADARRGRWVVGGLGASTVGWGVAALCVGHALAPAMAAVAAANLAVGVWRGASALSAKGKSMRMLAEVADKAGFGRVQNLIHASWRAGKIDERSADAAVASMKSGLARIKAGRAARVAAQEAQDAARAIDEIAAPELTERSLKNVDRALAAQGKRDSLAEANAQGSIAQAPEATTAARPAMAEEPRRPMPIPPMATASPRPAPRVGRC